MQKDLETISSFSKAAASDFTFSCTQPDQILTDLQDQMNSDFPALSDAARQYEIRYVPAQLEV